MTTIDAPFARQLLHRLQAGELDMLDLARQIGAAPPAGTLAANVGTWMQHVSDFRARARRRAHKAPS